jgi:methylated-DNA-[protein]-cysteine S-methyltransferase
MLETVIASVTLVLASIDAPWGPIRLAATARGVVAVDQLTAAADSSERLAGRFGVAPLAMDDPSADGQALDHLRVALGAFEQFLAGDLDAIDAVTIDLADRPAWDRLVLGAVRGIRPGRTASYGEVARMIGRAGAARAVGAAVGRNPVGLVVPCHRVIAGDGTLGGYGGGWWGGRQAGLELKRELLAREGVHPRASAGTS